MKLSFLAPTSRFAVNLYKFSRRHSIQQTITEQADYDNVIMITNGSPDNRIICVLSHLLNGDSINGIFKPIGKTRIDSLETITEYTGPNIRKVLVFIDQETQSVSEIVELVNKKLREKGCMNVKKVNERLHLYECSIGPNSFKVICVINGLEEVDTSSHCIEDHLIKVADIDCGGNSKEAWNGLSKEKQEEIYRIINTLQLGQLEEIFSQHIEALKLLKS